jgi:hypothetical protein
MFLRNQTNDILHGVKPGSSIEIPNDHADRINELLEAWFEELGEAHYQSLEDFHPMICYRALKEIIRKHYDGDVDAMTIVDMKLMYIKLGINERIPLITDDEEECQWFQDTYQTTKKEREKAQKESASEEEQEIP